MTVKHNRLTVVSTEEVDALLSKAQMACFRGRTRSDMLRELMTAGLDSWEKRAGEKNAIPKP